MTHPFIEHAQMLESIATDMERTNKLCERSDWPDTFRRPAIAELRSEARQLRELARDDELEPEVSERND